MSLKTTVDGPTAPLELDDSGRLTQDLECLRCGYNLRGAEAEGRCPECGLAVGRSARGQWLRYCDPSWLRCIWGGLNRLAVLIGCAAALTLVVWSGVLAVDTALPEWLAMGTPLVLGVTGVVLGVHGVWRATGPDPAGLGELRMSSRRMTRYALLTAAAMLPVGGVIAGQAGPRHGENFLLLFWLPLLLTPIALLWYGRALAKRIPRPRLARATVGVAVLLAASESTYLWLSDNWFGWMDAAGRWYAGTSAGSAHSYVLYSGVYSGRGKYSAGFYDLVLRLHFWIGCVLIAAVLLLPPLFIWYWLAMTREARIARQTWAKTGQESEQREVGTARNEEGAPPEPAAEGRAVR